MPLRDWEIICPQTHSGRTHLSSYQFSPMKMLYSKEDGTEGAIDVINKFKESKEDEGSKSGTEITCYKASKY